MEKRFRDTHPRRDLRSNFVIQRHQNQGGQEEGEAADPSVEQVLQGDTGGPRNGRLDPAVEPTFPRANQASREYVRRTSDITRCP